MIDREYCRTLARYGRWMNAKLYAICAGIPDAERKLDRGAFFGSIHGTLNHLLYGDLALLARFAGRPETMPVLGEELYSDFDELRDARTALDDRIESWVETLTEEWLAAPYVFTSQTDGVTRELPTWVLVAHLFQHGAHHRGQLTTLLSQLGRDPGETDIHKLPGLAHPLTLT